MLMELSLEILELGLWVETLIDAFIFHKLLTKLILYIE